MSQAVWQEVRLRLIDRIWLPPVNRVTEENQLHRPDLREYMDRVKASLGQCLSLTLTERLQFLDLSGLDPASLQLAFSFNWGLDGSGDHKNYHQLSKVDYTTKQVMSVCFTLK